MHGPTWGPEAGGASGDGAVYGRSPPPGFMRAAGWRFGVTGVPGVGYGSGGNGRACPWPGGREPGGTCGMVVDGRGIVGSIRRVCFSTSSSLNTNSSIGRVTNLVRRDIPRRADVIDLVLRACRHCLLHDDTTQIPPHSGLRLIAGHALNSLKMAFACTCGIAED